MHWLKILKRHPMTDMLVVCFCVSVLLLLLLRLWTPVVTEVSYSLDGQAQTVKRFPIVHPVRRNNEMSVRAKLRVRPFQARLFRIQVDDCLTSLTINKVDVISVSEPPLCLNGTSRDFSLGPFLREGVNTLFATVKDVHGVTIAFGLSVSPHDPLTALARWTMILSLCGIILMAFHRWLGPSMKAATAIIGLGIVLRLLYTGSVSYQEWAYDTSGHVDYIRYLMTHFWIPPATSGWEYHQPPLYYALAAAILEIFTFLTSSMSTSMDVLKQVSLLLSIGGLAALTWIGRLVFPEHKHRTSFLLYLALIATFPSLLMVSSRISNDTMYQFVAFVFLGCLLHWWQNGTTQSLLITSAVIGIGFLTKGNAYLLLPILWICIILRRATPWKKKALWIGSSIAIVAVLAGWLFLFRSMEAAPPPVLEFGNKGMGQGLRVQTSIETFLSFHPLEFLSTPYVSPWTDQSGRQYFFDYFFKSSLFGEFAFPKSVFPYSVAAVVSGLALLLFTATGFLSAFQKKHPLAAPFTVTAVIVVTGAIGYRLLHTFASNQDFRFSILLVPVFAFFAAECAQLPTRWLRRLIIALFTLASIAYALFILRLTIV